MSALRRHRAAIARLRNVHVTRRDVAWSLAMIRHLQAIEAITGEWESY